MPPLDDGFWAIVVVACGAAILMIFCFSDPSKDLDD